ncbi:MAG TPA: PD-(D/E)XK nuclease family protein [Polyangiaceae bacterium]
MPPFTPPFKNAHLSFSRIQRYEQCPRSFRFHYVDRLEARPGPELVFGKAMHVVLEQLVAEHSLESEPAPLSMAHAERLWQRTWVRDGLIGLAAFYEGLHLLESFVLGEGALDPRSILAVEQPFELTIGRFTVVGAIDRVDRIGPTAIRVRDYKTNRQLFTTGEVAESLQLSLYAIAARELWPWADTIELQYDMLRHNARQRTSRTEAELDAARQYIQVIGERTEADTAFAPRPNPNCVYCDHRTQCDAFAALLAGERSEVAADLSDLEAVGREREEVARIAKVAYARKGELEAVLRAQLQGRDKLDLGGVRYEVLSTCSLDYPLEPTLRVLEEATGLPRATLLAKLATVDKDALSNLLREVSKRLPRARATMLRAELEARAERTFAPRFSSKRVSA